MEQKTDKATAEGIKGRRVLVTGGAGAIGNNLVRRLCFLGAEVVVVDDFSSGHEANLADVAERIRLVRGDIAAPAVLENAFDGGIDKVFHLAAFFANQNSVDHPEKDLRTNGFGTLELIKASVAHRVDRFVFASSSCVYGAQEGVLEEERPLAPETPYAITKILGEQYLEFYRDHGGLAAVTLRYFNSYGPGEGPGKYRNVIPNFFGRALAGEPLVITGTGEETRDFTFVGDIVEGTLAAAVADGAVGGVFNLGTGRQTRILELAERINRLCGGGSRIEFAERRSWDYISSRCAGIGRARTQLAYEPDTELEEGLEQTYRWFVEHYLHSDGKRAGAPRRALSLS